MSRTTALWYVRMRTFCLQPILLYGISAFVPSPFQRQPCHGQ
jgi:hypothetical protein